MKKHPDTVTDQEFNKILKAFDEKLKTYNEIWFYVRHDFHPFYQKVLTSTMLKDKITQFTDLKEIV